MSGVFITKHPQLTKCVMELGGENKGEGGSSRSLGTKQSEDKVSCGPSPRHEKEMIRRSCPDRTRCFNFCVCQRCRVPWTLIRIFLQAISKTASCVTSGTLHFFSYTLNPFFHCIVFPGHFRTYPRRVCSLDEPTNKSKL